MALKIATYIYFHISILKRVFLSAKFAKSSTFVRAHARPALWLEFGVYRGTSINATAALRDTFEARGFPGALPRVVGFDTFEGIPQEWKTSKRQARPKWKQGAFSWREDYNTPTPPVRAGVELVTGLFNETLGPFLEANSGAVTFLNIDNDLHESCVEINISASAAANLISPQV